MTNAELTKIREDRKLGKAEFAKLLGVTPMLLGKYEKGTCEIPETVAKKLKDASDTAAATEIEAKKTVRKAGRKTKEAVEAAVQSDEVVATEIEVKKNTRKTARKAAEAVVEAAGAVEEKIEDAVVAEEIEVKKTARKAGRKAKEAAGELNKAAGIPNIVIQSPMGGYITTEDIAKKVPKNTTDVYVRVDENKLYYVLKNGKSGDVDIWE